MGLWPHQTKIIDQAREAMRRNHNVCIQSPTGSGKTVVFTWIVGELNKRGYRAWVMVPRNELLEQASNHLYEAGIPHGRISANGKESKAFHIHVVSKDTLIRRYDKIKNPPDYLVPDECHIALERQIEIWEKLNRPRTMGFTATPERGDGRGLSELYGELVMGPSLKELVELGYLSEPRYFMPFLKGLDKVHRRGSEYIPDELQKLLEERKVYGKAIEHYERHARGLSTIVFVRSVKEAEKTAHRFREAGHIFENIDGSMSAKKRKMLLGGMRNGRLHGLVSCDLLTYGVDLPSVACIILLRPTLSKALFYQMIGRGLRMHWNKEACIILDHVNNYLTHGHPLSPYEWKFHGREKSVSSPADKNLILKLCPEIDFLYCEKKTCVGCPHNKSGTVREAKKMQLIDMDLTEVKAPVKMNQRPYEERSIYATKIQSAVDDYNKTGDSGPIGKLLDIAAELRRSYIWVYWLLDDASKQSVNVSLLHEIARQKGYARGWVFYQKSKLRPQKQKRYKEAQHGSTADSRR